MVTRAALLTGGHSFDEPSFFAMCDALDGIEWTHLAHPTAYSRLAADGGAGFDVIVFYDMPGVEFVSTPRSVRAPAPPFGVIDMFARWTAEGVPLVFLHHSLASWPTWPEFAEIVGGRFHYTGGRYQAEPWPSSGYRHDVTHDIDIVAPEHPVCAGLGDGFTLTDELYLCPVDEDRVTPLLRSRARFEDTEFFSAELAVHGRRDEREGWSHPPASDLVAWTQQVDASTVVYLQPGDGPATYADPSYRRLVANAITWAATTAPSG